MSPDWSATPVPVPYADLTDPQSLNQYDYVRNIPTTKVDLDGHGCPPDCTDVEVDMQTVDQVAKPLIVSAPAFVGSAGAAAGSTVVIMSLPAAATYIAAKHPMENHPADNPPNAADMMLDALNPPMCQRRPQRNLHRPLRQRHSPHRQLLLHRRRRGTKSEKVHEDIPEINIKRYDLENRNHLDLYRFENTNSQKTTRRRTRKNRPIIEKTGILNPMGKIRGAKVKTYTWKEAFTQALGAAKTGNPGAQNFVGYCYDTGKGVRRDKKVARRWFGLAARNGNIHAIFNLAVLNDMGKDIRRNAPRAVRFYRQAALRGDLQAQANLAVMLLDGDGVKRDTREGLRWLRKASQRGDSRAQYNLGHAYAYGEDGVRKNDSLALKWLSKAAKQGHTKARRLLESLRKKKTVSRTKSAA